MASWGFWDDVLSERPNRAELSKIYREDYLENIIEARTKLSDCWKTISFENKVDQFFGYFRLAYKFFNSKYKKLGELEKEYIDFGLYGYYYMMMQNLKKLDFVFQDIYKRAYTLLSSELDVSKYGESLSDNLELHKILPDKKVEKIMQKYFDEISYLDDTNPESMYFGVMLANHLWGIICEEIENEEKRLLEKILNQLAYDLIFREDFPPASRAEDFDNMFASERQLGMSLL